MAHMGAKAVTILEHKGLLKKYQDSFRLNSRIGRDGEVYYVIEQEYKSPHGDLYWRKVMDHSFYDIAIATQCAKSIRTVWLKVTSHVNSHVQLKF